MSKIKNISRAGWVIVGLVAALLLVPTMAVAATVAYNGIEGTNGTTTTQNKALVTSAGQLLTTEVQPSKYEDYSVYIDGATGAEEECLGAARIPSGEAFIAEQVHVAVQATDATTSENDNGEIVVGAGGVFDLVADSPTQSACQGPQVTSGPSPDGTVGNVEIPLVPGYVFPSGYGVDVNMYGMNGTVHITGYLVPSADAPSMPTSASQYVLPRH